MVIFSLLCVLIFFFFSRALAVIFVSLFFMNGEGGGGVYNVSAPMNLIGEDQLYSLLIDSVHNPQLLKCKVRQFRNKVHFESFLPPLPPSPA